MITRALLLTDLVDSTRLVERLGDERAAGVFAVHDREARTLLARHGGREIDRTDGFFALFESAHAAAGFALAYHAVLADLGVNARVGFHVGPVTLRENEPADIVRGAKPLEVEGLAKPLAARVMALAAGGQTLLTATASEALGDVLPANAERERHGHYRFKGIEEPIEIFEVGMRGRAPFAPPADSDKGYRVVRAGAFWRPVREVRHNLPAERDAFVGRTAELRSLANRLDDGARLVTILGPGGTGKTRFVRRYGWTWLGDWPGGVYFTDLSEAGSLEGIYFALASALEVPLGKDDPGIQIANAIAGRGRCLVILDNFEQVAAHAPATVGRWLDGTTEASFVVTSRERLHLHGEDLFPLEPLPLEMDAINLFVARARAQKSDFALSDANRDAVAEVVRLLDGLPLAIELAAARVRVLSPAQLVERMRDRFSLLAGARGAAARQATLRAAIDWSWDLLAAWEQAAFAQCSVFDGGFTLEAAEAVLDLAAWPGAPPTMDAIQLLVDKSLLRSWLPEQARHDLAEPYFGMYISIHEYAAERLGSNQYGAKALVEQRHGHHFAQLGSDAAIEALGAPGGAKRRRMLALDLDNLVAACRRAVNRGDAPTAVATYRATWEVVELRGPFALAIGLGQVVVGLHDGVGASLRASAASTLARALRRAGRTDEARTWLTEALAHVRALGDRRREGRVLGSLGNSYREQGKMAEARGFFETALACARETGDRPAEGSVLGSLGLMYRVQGRSDDAREHFVAALAIASALGDRREEGTLLGNLGLLSSEQDRATQARDYLEAALAIAREVGDRGLEGVNLANLGQLENEQGEHDEARQHFEAALAIQREAGNRRLEAIALGNLGNIYNEQGRTTVAQENFAAALAIARELGNRSHQSFLLACLGTIHRSEGRSKEARADYEAALALAREADDHREQSIVHHGLGTLDAAQSHFAEALRHYDQALALARDGGYRRLEGAIQGSRGNLLARQGHHDAARDALRTGEALLREVEDRVELAKLLCIRGRVEAGAGDRDAARATLAEAESLTAAQSSSPDTELGREIVALRTMLA